MEAAGDANNLGTLPRLLFGGFQNQGVDPPPGNSDYKVILGSSYILIMPLLQGGGS